MLGVYLPNRPNTDFLPSAAEFRSDTVPYVNIFCVQEERERIFFILLFSVEDMQLLPSSKDQDNLWVNRPDMIALKQFQSEFMEVSHSGRFMNQEIIRLQWTEVASLMFLCWENCPSSRGTDRYYSCDTVVTFVMYVPSIAVSPKSSGLVNRNGFKTLLCQFGTGSWLRGRKI